MTKPKSAFHYLQGAAAQLSAEPVAHQYRDKETGQWCNFINGKHYTDIVANGGWEIRSVYTLKGQQ